jgi:hypothetical protein
MGLNYTSLYVKNIHTYHKRNLFEIKQILLANRSINRIIKIKI